MGLGYLTLDRGAPTLSGGEAQRIRLAAQLGSNLQGVCYVLDEPTIGLHARDNQILLNAPHKLGDKGNTLVVVEHDEDTIRRADHIIDIGPSAGKRGGRLVAQGSVADDVGRRRLRKPAATCCTPCATRCRHAGRWVCYGFSSCQRSSSGATGQKMQNRAATSPCTGCASPAPPAQPAEGGCGACR